MAVKVAWSAFYTSGREMADTGRRWEERSQLQAKEVTGVPGFSLIGTKHSSFNISSKKNR